MARIKNGSSAGENWFPSRSRNGNSFHGSTEKRTSSLLPPQSPPAFLIKSVLDKFIASLVITLLANWHAML
jgi:hypothetical protein